MPTDVFWKSAFAGFAAFASTAVIMTCYALYSAWKWKKAAAKIAVDNERQILLTALARHIAGEDFRAFLPVRDVLNQSPRALALAQRYHTAGLDEADFRELQALLPRPVENQAANESPAAPVERTL